MSDCINIDDTGKLFKFNHDQYYGSAIITKEVANSLCNILKYKTTISIGSGFAYWEYVLASMGCDIIATDIDSNLTHSYIPVEFYSSDQAVRKFNRDILFACHPTEKLYCDYDYEAPNECMNCANDIAHRKQPSDFTSGKCVCCAHNEFNVEDVAYNALSIFKGKIFIYVGNEYKLNERSKLWCELEKNWNLIHIIKHPNLMGQHSNIRIYERIDVLTFEQIFENDF